jgi:hypothetical protein
MSSPTLAELGEISKTSYDQLENGAQLFRAVKGVWQKRKAAKVVPTGNKAPKPTITERVGAKTDKFVNDRIQNASATLGQSVENNVVRPNIAGASDQLRTEAAKTIGTGKRKAQIGGALAGGGFVTGGATGYLGARAVDRRRDRKQQNGRG